MKFPTQLKTLFCLSLLACITSTAFAQTYSVIHTFTGLDGAWPESGVTIRGNALYGVVPDDCTPQCQVGPGVVYQLTHVGSNWMSTPLFFFSPDWSGGFAPISRVTFGPDGHIYGTTPYGGGGLNGVVFSLTPPASICKTANCLTENVLHAFTGKPDGGEPYHSELVFDPAGNLYGTTGLGGTSDYGTVFEMKKSGNTWTETPIYSFNGTDGGSPSNILRDSNGNLFGVLNQGGAHGFGSVFELTYTDGVGWQEKNLYDFQNGSDGYYPAGGLVQDSAGNLYGVSGGGDNGGGTIFELSPSGNTWTYTLLYSLSGPFGCGPAAALSFDSAGNLYGTTYCAGASGNGSVFKLSHTANGWVYSSLYDFTKGADGGWPLGNVSIDTDGTLYGTTRFGGSTQGGCASDGCGVVWMIKP